MSTERPSTDQARGALMALALELPSAVHGDVKRIFLPLLDWIDGTTPEPPQPRTDLRERLVPAENLALTVTAAALNRGEAPAPNTALVCALALARLAGLHDWTAAEAPVGDGPR